MALICHIFWLAFGHLATGQEIFGINNKPNNYENNLDVQVCMGKHKGTKMEKKPMEYLVEHLKGRYVFASFYYCLLYLSRSIDYHLCVLALCRCRKGIAREVIKEWMGERHDLYSSRPVPDLRIINENFFSMLKLHSDDSASTQSVITNHLKFSIKKSS